MATSETDSVTLPQTTQAETPVDNTLENKNDTKPINEVKNIERPASCSSQTSNTSSHASQKSDIKVNAKVKEPSQIAPATTVPSMFSFVLSPKNNRGDFPTIPLSLPGFPSVQLQVTQLPGAKVSDQFYLNLATPSVITALNATPSNNNGQIVLTISSQSLVPKNNQPNCVPTTPTVVNDPKKVRAIAPKPITNPSCIQTIDLSPNSKARNKKANNQNRFAKNKKKPLGTIQQPFLLSNQSQFMHLDQMQKQKVGQGLTSFHQGSLLNTATMMNNGNTLVPNIFQMQNGATSFVLPNVNQNGGHATSQAHSFVYDSATGTTRPFIMNPAAGTLLQTNNSGQTGPLLSASIDPNSGMITYFANPNLNGARTLPQMSTSSSNSIIFAQPGSQTLTNGTPIFLPNNGSAASNGAFIQPTIMPSNLLHQQGIQFTTLPTSSSQSILSASQAISTSSLNPIYINSTSINQTESGKASSDAQNDGEDILSLAWKLTQMDDDDENDGSMKDVVNLDMVSEEMAVASAEAVLNEEDAEKEKQIIESVMEKDGGNVSQMSNNNKEKSMTNSVSLEEMNCLNTTLDIERLLEQAARETVDTDKINMTKEGEEKDSTTKEDDKKMDEKFESILEDHSFLNSFNDDSCDDLDKINTSIEKEPPEETITESCEKKDKSPEIAVDKNEKSKVEDATSIDPYEAMTTLEQIQDTLNFLNDTDKEDEPTDHVVEVDLEKEKPKETEKLETQTEEEMAESKQLDLDLERAVAESNFSFEPGADNSLFDLLFLPEDAMNEESNDANLIQKFQEENTVVTLNKDPKLMTLDEVTQEKCNDQVNSIRDDVSDSGSELDFLPATTPTDVIPKETAEESLNKTLIEEHLVNNEETTTVGHEREDMIIDFDKITTLEKTIEPITCGDKEPMEQEEVVLVQFEDAKVADSEKDINQNSILEVIAPPSNLQIFQDEVDYIDEEVSPVKSRFQGLKSLDKMLKTCQKNILTNADISISSSSTENHSTDQSLNESNDQIKEASLNGSQSSSEACPPGLMSPRTRSSTKNNETSTQRRPTRAKSNRGRKRTGEEVDLGLDQPSPKRKDKESAVMCQMKEMENKISLSTHMDTSFYDMNSDNRPKSFGLRMSETIEMQKKLSGDNSLSSVANFSFLSKDQPMIEEKLHFVPPELNSDSENERDVEGRKAQISGLKQGTSDSCSGFSSTSQSPDELFHAGCNVDLPINSFCNIGDSFQKLAENPLSISKHDDSFTKFANNLDIPSFNMLVEKPDSLIKAAMANKTESLNLISNSLAPVAKESGKENYLNLVSSVAKDNSQNGNNIFSELINSVITNQNMKHNDSFQKISMQSSLLNLQTTISKEIILEGFAPRAEPIFDDIPDSRTPSPVMKDLSYARENELHLKLESVIEFVVDTKFEFSSLTVVQDEILHTITNSFKATILFNEATNSQTELKKSRGKKKRKHEEEESPKLKVCSHGPVEEIDILGIDEDEYSTSPIVEFNPSSTALTITTDTCKLLAQENHFSICEPQPIENKENSELQPETREPIKLKLKLPFITSCKEQLAEKKRCREEKKRVKEARRLARRLKALNENNESTNETNVVPETTTTEKNDESIKSISPLIVKPKWAEKADAKSSTSCRSRGRPKKKPTDNSDDKDSIEIIQIDSPQSNSTMDSSKPQDGQKRIFSTSREDRRSNAVFSARNWKQNGKKKKISSRLLPSGENNPDVKSTSFPNDSPMDEQVEETCKPLKLVIKLGNMVTSQNSSKKEEAKSTAKTDIHSDSQTSNVKKSTLESCFSSSEPEPSSNLAEDTEYDHLLMIAEEAETFMDIHQARVKKVVNQGTFSLAENKNQESTLINSGSFNNASTVSSESLLFPKEVSYPNVPPSKRISQNTQDLFPQRSYPGNNHLPTQQNPYNSGYSSHQAPVDSTATIDKSTLHRNTLAIYQNADISEYAYSRTNNRKNMAPQSRDGDSKTKDSQSSPLDKRLVSSIANENLTTSSKPAPPNPNLSLDMSTGSSDTTLDIVDETNTSPIQPPLIQNPAISTSHIQPANLTSPLNSTGKMEQIYQSQQLSVPSNSNMNHYNERLVPDFPLNNAKDKKDDAFTAACQAMYQQQFAAAMASYYQNAQFGGSEYDTSTMPYGFSQSEQEKNASNARQKNQHHNQSSASGGMSQQSSHHLNPLQNHQSSSNRQHSHGQHSQHPLSIPSAGPLPQQPSNHTQRSMNQPQSMNEDIFPKSTFNNRPIEDPSLLNPFMSAVESRSSVLNTVNPTSTSSIFPNQANQPSSDYNNSLSSSMQQYYSSAYTAVQQYAAAFNYYQSQYSQWSSNGTNNATTNNSANAGGSRSKR